MNKKLFIKKFDIKGKIMWHLKEVDKNDNEKMLIYFV